MAELGHEGGLLVAKAVGSVAGAWVSLVYLMPKSMREAASRFMTGVSCGVMFGGPAGLWLTERLPCRRALADRDDAFGCRRRQPVGLVGAGAMVRVANRYGAKTDPP